MSANVNTLHWSTNSVQVINDSGTLLIYGSNKDSSIIKIQMPLNIKPGTYHFGGGVSIFYINAKNLNIGIGGTLVITLNSQNVIAGTFTSTIYTRWGQLLYPINNGSFCMNY